MKSLTQAFLSNLSFTHEQLSMLKLLGSYQGKQALFYEQSPEVLESLQKVSVVESTESSNRIEGIIAPHNRIADLVLKDTVPKNRSEEEIAGYRDVLNLLHQSSNDMPVSVNVILQLHHYMHKYVASEGGKWKSIDNKIEEKLPDGTKNVRFIPVSSFETPRAMDSLIDGYHNCIEDWNFEPLVVIPAFVLDFLCIHPFRDGNGRCSRLLTLLLLYHFGYEVGRYISLDRVFEESKETYYDALGASSQGWHEGKHNILPWIGYFWGVLLKAYREFEERVGFITSGRGNKTEQVKKCVRKMIKPFSVSDIEKACPGISRDTIRLVLRSLRDDDLIEAMGKGRGAKWKKKR
ncbi:MAG: Fic family protein [Chlamydiota bacterium]